MTDVNIDSVKVQGAREHQFRTITLVLDNDYGAYTALTGAAREVLTEIPDLTLDAYRGAYGETDRALRWDVGYAAGEACADVVRAWVDDVPGVMGLLLADLLDFGDSTLWAEIGWNYLPEPGEMDADDFVGHEGDEEAGA